MPKTIKIRKAIISVSKKKGIVGIAKFLEEAGAEILSTGGTARVLRDAGISVKDVAEHTGSPEMLDGRVKTLHPKVHGGLLSRRDNPKDMEEIKKYGIELIDLVIVNLYPFEETIAKPGVTFAEAIENIDIGGPAMLRSASKNFWDVIAIVDPADYERIMFEWTTNNDISYKTRMELAQKVFAHTSRYDGLIADYLSRAIAKLGKLEGGCLAD
jgi:phosphoribosylaminoimidazolecarboxamide formyltransferase/IMP cyclohydrolase